MSVRSKGLAVFWVAVGVDVLALLLDATLSMGGGETISGHVWACPWLGAPIVAWQGVGVGGLLAHFYGRE